MKTLVTKNNDLRKQLIKTEETLHTLSRLVNKMRYGETYETAKDPFKWEEDQRKNNPLSRLCKELELLLGEFSSVTPTETPTTFSTRSTPSN